MGDSQTSTSGTSAHKHSTSSSDGSALRTGTTKIQVLESGTYFNIEAFL